MRHVVPVQALALQETYEAEDEMDDAASDAREAQQKRSRAAAIASGAPLPDTSAYFHERLYWGEHASALAYSRRCPKSSVLAVTQPHSRHCIGHCIHHHQLLRVQVQGRHRSWHCSETE